MSAIVKGLGDLVGSILEIFKGILSTIVGAFQTVLNLFANVIKNLFSATEGILGFILGQYTLMRERNSAACMMLTRTCCRQHLPHRSYCGGLLCVRALPVASGQACEGRQQEDQLRKRKTSGRADMDHSIP